MTPIPLSAPDGTVYAYACGRCRQIGGGISKSSRPKDEAVAFAAEWSHRDADRCCRCSTCQSGLPVDVAFGWCAECEAKHALHLAAVAVKQSEFDARAAVALKLSAFPEAAQGLCSAMQQISEEYYCAGWLMGLEFTLWAMVKGGPRHFGMGEVTDAEVAALELRSTEAAGWWRWVDGDDAATGGEMFTPIAEWESLYAAHVAERGAP